MHQSLVKLFETSCEQYATSPMLGFKVGQTWRWLTYAQVEELVDQFRGGLAQLGVAEGDRVAIVADNCVEWAVAAYAVYGRQACFVPMYAAQSPEDWRYILKDSGAKAVLGATAVIHNKLKQIAAELPELQHVIGIDLPESDPESFKAICAAGKEEPCASRHPESSDLAGYIYTSGTTGNPKGVKLTHRNICANVAEFEPCFQVGQARSLAFLPWAHAYGQTSELHFLVGNGGALAINDEVPNLINNLSEVRPSILVAVPRIFNRIYDGVNKKIAAKPSLVQSLFRSGLRLAKRKKQGAALGLLERVTLGLAERLIFSDVRKKFGGQLKLVISGSAALNPSVAEFIDALGIDVYEGYGLTETAPVVATNYPGHRKIGTVGPPLANVTVQIDETQSEEPGEGEVVVYGPNVMVGYHNLPEESARVLGDDGGFRTGDLGRLDADGYLCITGRLKEQYKLETGKYVSPAALEEQMKLSPMVANIMLYGANRPFNVALVVADPDNLEEWASGNGIKLSASTRPKVVQMLQAELEKFTLSCKNYEKPKKIAVISEDFTTDNGLLTPSLKIKRNKVAERYRDTLEELY